MAVVANLFVNIAAKTSAFSKGMKGVVSEIKSFAGTVGAGFGLGAGFKLADLAGRAFVSTVKEAGMASARLHNAMRQLSMTATKEFSALSATLGNAIAPLFERINKDLGGTEKGMLAVNRVAGMILGGVADIINLIWNGGALIFQAVIVNVEALILLFWKLADVVSTVFGGNGFASEIAKWSTITADAADAMMASARDRYGDIWQNTHAAMTGAVSPANTGAVGQTSEEAISLAREHLRTLKDIKHALPQGGPR